MSIPEFEKWEWDRIWMNILGGKQSVSFDSIYYFCVAIESLVIILHENELAVRSKDPFEKFWRVILEEALLTKISCFGVPRTLWTAFEVVVHTNKVLIPPKTDTSEDYTCSFILIFVFRI